MKGSIIWAGVVLVAVVAALSVGLSFAGWSDQAVAGWTTAIGALAVGILGLVIKVEGKTDSQTEQLSEISTSVATVERRTNGELDERIRAAMREAAEEGAETGAARVLAVLRQQGVLR